jgi:hypothetical protein
MRALSGLPQDLREQLSAIDPARDCTIPPLASAHDLLAQASASERRTPITAPLTTRASRGRRGRWLVPVLAASVVAVISMAVVSLSGNWKRNPVATSPASPTLVKPAYPQFGRIIDTRPGLPTVPLVSGTGHAGSGQLVMKTFGSSGCPILPDTITVESPTLVTVHLAFHHRGGCPSNLVSFRTVFTTPGLNDNAVVTVRVVAIGVTPGSTQTTITTLPPASALAAASTSPAKVLLEGGWLLRTLDGPALGGIRTPDQPVVITFGLQRAASSRRAILTVACNITTATLSATTVTFEQPWHPISSGCADLGSSQANWLYNQLLTGTASWHGRNATITLSKPGVGTATFRYTR